MKRNIALMMVFLSGLPLGAMDFVTQMDWDKAEEFQVKTFKVPQTGGTQLTVRETPQGLSVTWPGIELEAEVVPPAGEWEIGFLRIHQSHYSSRAWKDIVIREIYPRLPQNSGNPKSFPWAEESLRVKTSQKKSVNLKGSWIPQILVPWQGPLKDGTAAKEESLEVVNQELGVEFYLVAWQKWDAASQGKPRIVFLRQVRFSTAGYALVDCKKPLGQRVQPLRPSEIQLKVLEKGQIVLPEGRLLAPPGPGEELQLFYNYEFWK